MTEIALFHHAQGLTDGVRALAEELRAAGHTVHTPDLYEGRTFASTDEGVAHAKEIGFGTIATRGRLALDALPDVSVYAGISLGVMCAQEGLQTRPGARGGLLLAGCIPPAEFDAPWPEGVRAQVHMMEDDGWVLEGDLDAARTLAAEQPGVEVFLYDGDRHLFMDRSTSDFDEEAATLVTERMLAFLGSLG